MMLSQLAHKADWSDECEQCHLPRFLHKGPCTRKEEMDPKEVMEIWRLFRSKMKPVLLWQSDQEEKAKI